MTVRGCKAIRALRPPLRDDDNTAATALGFGPAPPLLPRLLLRDHFLGDGTVDAAAAFVEFETTLKIASTAPLRLLHRLDGILQGVRDKAMYSFPADRLQNLMVRMPDESYCVMLAVVFRLHTAHVLARRPDVAEDTQLRHWLQLFIDTHIDLCLAMRLGEVYADAELTGAFANEETLCTSVLDQWYPHDTRVIHCGDMPDLSACLEFGNAWYLVKTKQRVSGTWEGLVHLVGSKTQTHKCQVRNFVRILHTNAEKNPVLMTVIRALVCTGMLGNYPTARVRPDFDTRLHIVLGLRPTHMTDRELLLWIYENEQIVFAVVKEYYHYLVEFSAAMMEVLNRTTHWDAVRFHVTVAMDIVRSGIGYAHTLIAPLAPLDESAQRDAWDGTRTEQRYVGASVGARAHSMHAEVMSALNDDLRLHHDERVLPLITKLRKLPFAEMIVAEMTRFFNRNLLDVRVVRPQNHITLLGEIDGTDGAAETIETIQFVVKHRVKRHHCAEQVELRWLAAFGVTSDGIRVMRELCFKYETTDMPDNSISTKIATMFTQSRRDFCVIFTYFDIVREHRDRASFKLPRSHAERQIAALRHKYKVNPWDPLPETARKCRMCLACRRWLHPRINPKAAKTHTGVYALARDNALYNYSNRHICCGRKESANDAKKLLDTGRFEDIDTPVDDTDDDKKEAKCVRNFLAAPVCADMESVEVDMVGRVQRLGGKLWALCEICASITQWEGSKFAEQGFTCMLHGEGFRSGTSLAIDEAQRTPSTAEHRRGGEPARKVALGAGAGKLCTYCHAPIDGSREVTEITVIDDDIIEETDDGPRTLLGTYDYKLYVLCQICGKALPRTPDYAVNKSVLHARIKNVRERRNSALNIKPRKR